MSFAMFFLAEVPSTWSPSLAVATDLFLGAGAARSSESLGLDLVLIKGRRAAVLLRLERWTLPRYRYDQLMSFGGGAVARLGDHLLVTAAGCSILSCVLRLLRAVAAERR